jgi:hypothetical protein
LGLPGLAGAWTAPDVPAAWAALVETPLRVTGDSAGAAGLLCAPAVALVGDAVALVDATWLPAGPLEGWLSGPVHRVAMAVSWTGTSILETLRAEDIERLPEAMATYRGAAPGVGRLDTLLSGVGALRLAVRDLLTGPVLAMLHLGGADGVATRLERDRDEARTKLLGPLTLTGEPSLHSPTSASESEGGTEAGLR